ncbi:MAG: TPR end-of-group domain-containing protein [Planctomycetota bacterium]
MVVGCALLLGAIGAPPVASADALRTRIYASFRAGDPEQAARLIDLYLEQRPDDAAMIYNAACARSRLGRLEEAEALLMRAIKGGFLNFARMRRDPDMVALRDRPVFRAIMAARDAADAMLARRRVEEWTRRYGADRYRHDVDEELNLSFVTALGDDAHARLRRRVSAQGAHLAATLFGQPPEHDVLVAVPHPDDAAAMFHDPHVHGCYQHGRRQLVTADTGVALRHELVHAFHHHHMDRCGQEHPIWIQEGLGCLYESCRLDERGALVPLADDRHEIVQALAARGAAPSWKTLLAMSREQFMADPGVHYAVARSILAFVAAEGALTPWYHAYVAGFDTDATGARALETTLGAPVDELETRWRTWLAAGPGTEDAAPEDPFDGPDPDADLRREAGAAYERARSHYAAGRFRESIAALREVLELDDRHAEAHYTLGLVFVRLDDRAAARRQHEILATLDPSLTSLLGNLTTD